MFAMVPSSAKLEQCVYVFDTDRIPSEGDLFSERDREYIKNHEDQVMPIYHSALINALATPEVVMLDLGAQSIESKHIPLLCKLLPSCISMTGLNLEENKIDDAGAIELAKALPLCQSLQRVILRTNEIEDAGALAIAHAVAQTSHINVVELPDNPITMDAQNEIVYNILSSANARRSISVDIGGDGSVSGSDSG
uniref:Uncharacterized protein n=1 Tax=Fibrocapsa japonica TaxID=94617 RepID=A0A7S2V734_9STRA|mmetsp:Transcript_9542/g.14640  ORF Transcript_9542/g.14640 Transcript_9542/m.14640 type:complete len:195 (+) Transcript_9542:66-650(+)